MDLIHNLDGLDVNNETLWNCLFTLLVEMVFKIKKCYEISKIQIQWIFSLLVFILNTGTWRFKQSLFSSNPIQPMVRGFVNPNIAGPDKNIQMISRINICTIYLYTYIFIYTFTCNSNTLSLHIPGVYIPLLTFHVLHNLINHC